MPCLAHCAPIKPTRTRHWVSTGGPPGADARIRLSYPPAQGDGRRAVEIDYALAGWWLERNDDGVIDRIDIPGGRVLERPGLPRVPAQVFSAALPFGAAFDPERTLVTVEEVSDADEPVNLFPVPLPRIEGSPAVLAPDPAAWASDAWFPAGIAEVRPAPDLGGMARAVVRINPLAIVPCSGRLQVRARVHVRLICAVSNGGHYPPGRVDRLSPLVRELAGAAALLNGQS